MDLNADLKDKTDFTVCAIAYEFVALPGYFIDLHCICKA